MKNSWKLVVAGEGGQGVQALAETLALAAYLGGLNAIYIPNFGIEQRGGVSLAMVQIAPGEIGSPKFLKADLIVALSGRSLERCRQYASPETTILYDSSLIEAPEVSDKVVGLQSYDTVAPELFAGMSGRIRREVAAPPAGFNRLLALPAADLARKQLHPRVFNMVVLGAILALVDLVSLSLAKEALIEKLNHRFEKESQLKELNFKALDLGYEEACRSYYAAAGEKR